jgi:hypothetical protein
VSARPIAPHARLGYSRPLLAQDSRSGRLQSVLLRSSGLSVIESWGIFRQSVLCPSENHREVKRLRLVLFWDNHRGRDLPFSWARMKG